MEQDNSGKQQDKTSADAEPLPVIKTDADKQNNKSRHTKKKSDPDRKKSWKRSWRTASPLTKLTLIFAGIVAMATVATVGATVANVVVAYWQWTEIHSSSSDTRKLAQAAADQANTTQRQLELMGQQTNTMTKQAEATLALANTSQGQLTQLERSVDVAQDQADAMQRQADASRSFANSAEQSSQTARDTFQLIERPYLGVDSVGLDKMAAGQKIVVKLVVTNTGRTPALNTSISSNLSF